MNGYYLYRMDRDRPEECARDLKARGFTAVVAPPTPGAARACREAGLEVYACLGAFSLREGDPEEYLAEDAFGVRKPWFHSGCPNEPALLARSLARAAALAAEEGTAGVFLDGARFASPEPGEEPFVSCFCPRCMEKGRALGFDMDRMRREARAFAAVPGAPVPEDWLRFRAECTREVFAAYNTAVRAAGKKAGAFVFAPSLARLVGQGFVYDGSGGPEQPDLLAPMLYRLYGERPGTACLNSEYAALAAFFQRRGDEDVSAEIARLTGVTPPAGDPDRLRADGFSPEAIARETLAASAGQGTLAPILQLDDGRLAESVAAARAAGAAAVGFFAYAPDKMSFLDPLTETPQLRKKED